MTRLTEEAIFPGRSAQERWFHEVLLSQRRFWSMVQDPRSNPETLILCTRQHIMLVLSAKIRVQLLNKLRECIAEIRRDPETTFIEKRYRICEVCQDVVGEVLHYCQEKMLIGREEEEGSI